MIELVRRKDHKWIMQKNCSSAKIIEAYLSVVNGLDSVNYSQIQKGLKEKNIYKGRSDEGSLSTMGVRFSQMCFYMFGYKNHNMFIPSPMTSNILEKNNKISVESNSLVSLYSLQFPNPYSKTPRCFKLHVGRLIVKLLLDARINKRLYIDELIWFLPFVETLNEEIYEELIESIIEYRKLTYIEKLNLFKSIDNYVELFANVTHEMNYYFSRIFTGFGVFHAVKDYDHNNGKLFSFKHGNTETYRTDAILSNEKISGYLELSDEVIKDAEKLNSAFSAFDEPTSMQSEDIYSENDWKISLYESEPLEYLSTISTSNTIQKEISDIVNNMIKASKYGSKDGSEFEQALKPVMELFRETLNVEIIAGAGNTDLLCAMCSEDYPDYKMNIDAKTRKGTLEELNARRLKGHLQKHGSKFCIVVAPRFAHGVSDDIAGSNIVTVRAEDLGHYCYKECINSKDHEADFSSIYNIIKDNMGTDITENLRKLTSTRYGISI